MSNNLYFEMMFMALEEASYNNNTKKENTCCEYVCVHTVDQCHICYDPLHWVSELV